LIDVVLYQPEIPPNTGNIIRLCANTGSRLHLIGPLGFSLDDRQLRRAGLDYHDLSEVHLWQDWDTFRSENSGRLLTLSTKHETSYSEFSFCTGDLCLFGSESRGLPESIRNLAPESQRLTIPMRSASRSLNLSNSVAVVAYEAWRQLGFTLD